MTCRETQENLSLYLYGELDAAAEEAVEQHLHDCSACAEALAQESVWHEALNASEAPLPLELLSQCRRDLHEEFQVIRESSQPRWMKWIAALVLSPSPLSARLAMASMLVCLGFGLSQLLMHHGLPGDAVSFGGVDQAGEMGLVNPVQRRVRMIQPVEGNNVQIVFDEIHERVVAGSCDDARIRRLLLAAAKDPADPGLLVAILTAPEQPPLERARISHGRLSRSQPRRRRPGCSPR